MSYISKHGKRPPELASKSSHSHIINDPAVVDYLHTCEFPKNSSEIQMNPDRLFNLNIVRNPIKLVIAIDGGYTEVSVKKTFPSSKIAFFQFGALLFDLEHLRRVSEQPFIFPENMAKFKELERIKLALPISNISYKKEGSLTKSVRKTLYDFFTKKRSGRTFLDSLSWFVFEKYNIQKEGYTLSSCPNPNCSKREIFLSANQNNHSCSKCSENIFLTDVFRLHEAIDDDLGAGGVLGYLTTLIEHIVIIHNIKYIYEKQPSLFKEILFLKDGPLAFFGQTASMHKLMRNLVVFLQKKYDLYLIGLEKSGAFVEHANEICYGEQSKIQENQILLLDNTYIYRYIMPGKADDSRPYASSSYYSSKLIFKDRHKKTHVATIPVSNKNVVLDPKKDDFKNLDIILSIVSDLKCDMYDNALVPIALVNHLVSLANHPSSILLEKFAKSKITKK